MRFKDWKSETKHHEHHVNALREAGERCFLIRPAKDDHGYAYTTSRDKADIAANVRVNHGAPPGYTLLLYSVNGGGHYVDLATLTDDEFERIKTIRREVQLWIDGERDELPTTMPWETPNFSETQRKNSGREVK